MKESCPICDNKTSEMYSNEIATAPWTCMCSVFRDNNFYLVACGDGEAFYRIKFCPECGKKVGD